MKRILFAICTTFLAHSTFAYDCTVLLLDNYNRIIQSYHGYSNGYDMCRDELRDCNRERTTIYGRNNRCERLNTYYSGGGTYNPGGGGYNPNPGNSNTIQRLLRLSDRQLATEAYDRRVGACTVTSGNYNTACDYYVNVGNRGFQNGTGCASARYMYTWGCNHSDEFTNAGCLIRYSLERGQCF